jgi:hypothetical protein
MEHFARARARAVIDKARERMDDLHAQALTEGYQRGITLALQSLWPVIDALRQEQSALRQAMWQEITHALRSVAAAPGVAVAQIEAACAQWGASVGDAVVAVLHLPMDQQPLVECLRAIPALAQLDIRLARREYPLLEVGHLVYELDLEGSLSMVAADALDQNMPQLEAACVELAESYSRRVQDAALSEAATKQFSRLRKY